MTEPTEQLYGWLSEAHAQSNPEDVLVYATPDGRKVHVTSVSHGSADPGGNWPDARCVGPVTERIRMSDRTMQRLCEQRKAYVVESIHKQLPPAWHNIFRADNLI